MLKIYNTLTKKKESLEVKDNKIRMFVCGPTVYDYPHIGHARTYIMFDVIAKYLKSKGFDVFYLQNITDIDDKIIARAKERNVELKKLTEEFEKIYMEDMKSLGINSVDKYARATEHIPEIVSQVKKLIDKGHAYEIPNDGYYFDLSTFPDYGKLSGRTAAQAEDSVSRIDEGINKRSKGDFALWKLSKEGEPAWSFKTGEYLGIVDDPGRPAFAKAMAGKPGWHIEDTAISEKYLGDQYEVHCGAQDLMFPHHESEIAQQEAASGKKPFVSFWLHSGLLTVEGKKMSKSLGNFVTIRDVLKKYPPEAVRMMFLMSHYRSPVDYSEDNLKQAEAAVNRLSEFKIRLQALGSSASRHLDAERPSEVGNKFKQEMDDDFNTPKAIAVIFDLVKKVNPMIDRGEMDKETADKMIDLLSEFNKILGIVPDKFAETPDEVQKLVTEREKLRQDKKFDEADKLREKIKDFGYEVEDTSYGPLVKK